MIEKNMQEQTTVETLNEQSKEKAFAFMQGLVNKRKECTISQHELAARIGVKQSCLARTESKRCCVRLDTAIKIADALGMEIVLVPKKN